MSEQDYLNLVQKCVQNGFKKPMYTGEDHYTMSLLGESLRFDLREGFPIFTTKKVNWEASFREMLWFIKGQGDVVDLHKQGVKIWDEWGLKYIQKGMLIDSLEEYQELIDNDQISHFSLPIPYTNMTCWEEKIWEDDCIGTPYRDSLEVKTHDQTSWVINRLQQQPFRRDMVVSLWNPTQLYDVAEKFNKHEVVLPACVFAHQLLFTDVLNMIVTSRSCDALIGGAFNVCQYAMLLHMYAHVAGLQVGELIFNFGDFHVYWNHIDQFMNVQRYREVRQMPTFNIVDRAQQRLQDFVIEDFIVEGYKPHSFIKYPLTVAGGK